jgi:hypothetical protein
LGRVALDCACDAGENHFQFRWGAWTFEDLGVTVLFNNNPYAKGRHYRDEEVAWMRAELEKVGIASLAYATYPPEGEEDAGYTYALVLDCLSDREKEVEAIRHKAFVRTWERLTGADTVARESP